MGAMVAFGDVVIAWMWVEIGHRHAHPTLGGAVNHKHGGDLY